MPKLPILQETIELLDLILVAAQLTSSTIQELAPPSSASGAGMCPTHLQARPMQMMLVVQSPKHPIPSLLLPLLFTPTHPPVFPN